MHGCHYHDNVEIIATFEKMKANIRHTNKFGLNALYLAARSQHSTLIAYFLKSDLTFDLHASWDSLTFAPKSTFFPKVTAGAFDNLIEYLIQPFFFGKIFSEIKR
jgi:hypothetical protein